jgi:hypothetical protein
LSYDADFRRGGTMLGGNIYEKKFTKFYQASPFKGTKVAHLALTRRIWTSGPKGARRRQERLPKLQRISPGDLHMIKSRAAKRRRRVKGRFA